MNELTPCELRDANLIWKLFDEEERIIEDALQYAKSDIEGRLRASDGMCGPREYCIFAIRTIQKYQHENAYRRQRVRAVRRLLSQRPELRERIVQFELAMGR